MHALHRASSAQPAWCRRQSGSISFSDSQRSPDYKSGWHPDDCNPMHCDQDNMQGQVWHWRCMDGTRGRVVSRWDTSSDYSTRAAKVKDLFSHEAASLLESRSMPQPSLAEVRGHFEVNTPCQYPLQPTLRSSVRPPTERGLHSGLHARRPRPVCLSAIR